MTNKIAENLINNFDFDEAVDFIKDHGDTTVAEKVLSMARSSFTEKKVLRELERIRDTEPTPDPEPVQDQKDPAELTAQEALDKMIEDKNDLLKKRDHLRGQLELTPTDQDRFTAAFEIVQLTRRISRAWHDINLVTSGEPLPAKEEQHDVDKVFEGADPVQVERIRKNYISYRAKARKGNRPAELLPFYDAVIKEAERRQNGAV